MRVHQLAKELNLKANELFPHLKKLGIEFKNHMSTISTDDIERVRKLLNPPTAEEIVEKRLQPTLIRRRRKVVVEEPTEEPKESAEKEAASETPAIVEPTKKKEGEAETLPVKEAEQQKKVVDTTPSQKPPAVKIISKKVELPEVEKEEEEVTRKGKLKREKPKKERFFPIASSKDIKEEEEQAPSKKLTKTYRPFPYHKKKPLSLVKPKKTEITIPKAIKRKIKVVEGITVGQLAKRMSIKTGEVIKKLMGLGVMATVNKTIDNDSALLAAHEFGYEIELVPIEEEQILTEKEDTAEELLPRAPIVTVMGHIDHGKTSLLDAIRQTNVIEKEAGGITQHIGAYLVKLDKGNIAFIDTPGHEAFTTMRARGAKVTDIVVLVVAADDGVMPQTIEAIDHSKAAKVPIIVAINKIDKPNANPEKVKQSLSEYELVPEDWGGDTLYAEISAKKQEGIEELLETILLQAEMLELKVNFNKPAKGTVIEAKLDKNKGPIATILVQGGTLKEGDTFVSGVHFGKVRALIDSTGEKISQAGPSTPVQVFGLSGVPDAGDNFLVVDEGKKARQAGQYLQQKQREKDLTESSKGTLEGLQDQTTEVTVKKELNAIIKADVNGTIEALTKSLEELGNADVQINIIHCAVGSINQSDVMLASASQAIIIGFGVKPNAKAKQFAEHEKVDIRLYNIIYDAISDIKNSLEVLLDPTLIEKISGKAEVRQIFNVSKLGAIAGSFVLDGKIARGTKMRLMRNGTLLHQGRISSLRRFKDTVREVESGHECGIVIEGFREIEVGDIIECYTIEEIATKL